MLGEFESYWWMEHISAIHQIGNYGIFKIETRQIQTCGIDSKKKKVSAQNKQKRMASKGKSIAGGKKVNKMKSTVVIRVM